MALSLKNRIKKKSDLDSVFSNKKSFRGIFISLKFIENNLNVSRFFISIPTKISHKATERNRFKRILSQNIEKNLLSIRNGLDIAIFLQRKGDKEALIRDLNHLLNKVQ